MLALTVRSAVRHSAPDKLGLTSGPASSCAAASFSAASVSCAATSARRASSSATASRASPFFSRFLNLSRMVCAQEAD